MSKTECLYKVLQAVVALMAAIQVCREHLVVDELMDALGDLREELEQMVD